MYVVKLSFHRRHPFKRWWLSAATRLDIYDIYIHLLSRENRILPVSSVSCLVHRTFHVTNEQDVFSQCNLHCEARTELLHESEEIHL